MRNEADPRRSVSVKLGILLVPELDESRLAREQRQTDLGPMRAFLFADTKTPQPHVSPAASLQPKQSSAG